MPGIQVGLFRRPLHMCCSDVTLTAVDPRNYVFSHRRTQTVCLVTVFVLVAAVEPSLAGRTLAGRKPY